MVDARDHARVDAVLESVREQISAVVRVRRERAQLIGRAAKAGGRVIVTVDADGAVTDTRFSPDIEDLTYDEIAEAVTAAAGEAAAQVRRQSAELKAQLRGRQPGLPDLSEIVPGVPSLAAVGEALPDFVAGLDSEGVQGDSKPRDQGGLMESSW